MKISFWGTRGSIPNACPETVRYGGNTACVEVRSAAGARIVLDCGTGAARLGRALMASGEKPVSGALLISHTHWDHIQGLPFFAPLFVPGNEWRIYAPRGLGQPLRETLAGQMQYDYFPITLEAMGADIHFHELVEGEFMVGEVKVTAQYLDHPALTLGYRLEVDGVTMVYVCDHECSARVAIPDEAALKDQERRHVDFLRGADLVIHDAQYTVAEYPNHIGWGHSTPEYAAAVCRAAGVGRLVLTHHDPVRDDDQVDAMIDDINAVVAESGGGPAITAAAEGETITLTPAREASPPAPPPVETALEGDLVVLGDIRAGAAAVLRAAVGEEGLPLAGLADHDARHPSLVLLDANAPEEIAAQAATPAPDGRDERASAVLIVTEEGQDPPAAAPEGADTLVWPFSRDYARARLRAAVMRTQCRWIRASLPEDEGPRITELHRLEILDTEPEERFDRLTRMASKAFDVPIALVSLIDEDRQWFKSCFGAELDETPRELAFCAHTVLKDDTLVVSDTLLDTRFADHPFVIDGPRVRFYAGSPIWPDGRHAIGTLCLIDLRPRDLSETQVALLKDFAKLAELEIARGETG